MKHQQRESAVQQGKPESNKGNFLDTTVSDNNNCYL